MAALVQGLPVQPAADASGPETSGLQPIAPCETTVGLWRLQHETNLPMLLLASVRLAGLANRLGVRRLLFSARDGLHWLALFDALNRRCGWGFETRYFLTSRVCRLLPSPSYLAYARASIDEFTMVVDLCGTAWTLSHLYRRLDRVAPTFLLHDLGPGRRGVDPYRAVLPPVDRIAVSSLVGSVPLNNSLLEVANYTDAGMTLDVVGEDVPVAVVEDPAYPPRVLAAVQVIAAARDAFIGTMKGYDLEAVVREAQRQDEQLPTVVLALYGRLCSEAASVRDVLRYHIAQDRRTVLRFRQGLRAGASCVEADHRTEPVRQGSSRP